MGIESGQIVSDEASEDIQQQERNNYEKGLEVLEGYGAGHVANQEVTFTHKDGSEVTLDIATAIIECKGFADMMSSVHGALGSEATVKTFDKYIEDNQKKKK